MKYDSKMSYLWDKAIDASVLLIIVYTMCFYEEGLSSKNCYFIHFSGGGGGGFNT